MITWILLSTIFLAVFLILRAIFVSKINIRVMFVLWILVAVRLLVPTYIPIQAETFTQYSISALTSHILNLDETIPYILADNTILNDSNDTQTNISASENAQSESTNQSDLNQSENNSYDSFLLENENDVLAYILNHPWQFVWILGMLIVAASMIVSNLKWYQHLRRYRTPLNTITDHYDCPLTVYYVKSLKSPCLVGFFRPCIYVNDQIFDDAKGFYIIRHELTHYKHKDNIWMLVQMICVCIHWFNPLVWYAAFLFRRDNECVCDAVAVEDFTPEDRLMYGRLLLNTAAAKYNLTDVLTTATSMSMEGKTLKKRIHIILNKAPKRILGSLIAALIAILLFASAITGNADMGASIWSGSYIIKNFENTERITYTFYEDGTMMESSFGYYRFDTNENGDKTIILSTERGGVGLDISTFEKEKYVWETLAEFAEKATYADETATFQAENYETSNTLYVSYLFNPYGIYEHRIRREYDAKGNTITIGVDEWVIKNNPVSDDMIILKHAHYPDTEMILEPLCKTEAWNNEYYFAEANPYIDGGTKRSIVAFKENGDYITYELSENGVYQEKSVQTYRIENEKIIIMDGLNSARTYTYSRDDRIGIIHMRQSSIHYRDAMQRIDYNDLEWRNDHEILFE